MTTANKLRQMFLDYFEKERGHRLVASSPIVPPDDPTMLFTSAGMVQFKPLYAGTVDPLPYTRAVSCQKCLRAGGKDSDLENVGKTLRHHTFFEMLGNFSFGDYFKREALLWGWDFVWNRMKLPKERLWATIFEEDDEAEALLEKEIGIPLSRIIRLNAKENFWGPAGDTGACGPCSEIMFFMGTDEALKEAISQDRETIARRIVEEGDLFLEIWNMVFPQFNQQPDGSRPPLKNRGIDTGTGLERMTTALQFVQSKFKITSPYETDLLAPIVGCAREKLDVEWVAGTNIEQRRLVRALGDYRTQKHVAIAIVKKYASYLRAPWSSAVQAGKDKLYCPSFELVPGAAIPEDDHRKLNEALEYAHEKGFLGWESNDDSANLPLFAANAVADHVRALTFVLSEGHIPSNDGRGYVLRRILRRALRFATLTDMSRSAEEIRELDPFLYKLVEPVVETMGAVYPELKEHRDFTEKVVRREEEQFLRTMKEGEKRLRQIIGDARHGERIVHGEDVFRLHDTYGYPPDMTFEIIDDYNSKFPDGASERVEVDKKGFEAARKKAREEAKRSWKGGGGGAEAELLDDVFDKYGETEFLGYEGAESEARVVAILSGGKRVDEITGGQEALVVLEETPFYAESGGQVGDTGILRGEQGEFIVTDTRKTASGLFLHAGKAKGTIRLDDTVQAQVDAARRMAIRRNHTVAHLLQAALKQVVGKHITQSGSFVGPDGMRFDFSHTQACTPDELQQIERRVNEYILADLPVSVEEMPIEDARKKGAIAPFGEKYGHRVRVVEIGGDAQRSGGDAHRGGADTGRCGGGAHRSGGGAHRSGGGVHRSGGDAGRVSLEFCGGTHLERTGQIASFRLMAESSVAAGIRRIEGVTGLGAYEAWAATRDAAGALCRLLAVKEGALSQRVAALQDEIKKLHKEIKRAKQAGRAGGASIESLIAGAQEISGLKVIAAKLDEADAEQLRQTADQLREKVPNLVCVLGSVAEGKVSLLCAVSKDQTKRIKAGDVIKRVAAIVGGGGGGRPELAQAGGKNPEKLDEAIAQAPEIIASLL